MPTIKVDADLGNVISAADKTGAAFKQAGHHVRGIGEQWIHVNSHMATSLLRGTAIFELFKKAGEEANKIAKATEDIAKKAGDSAIARSTAVNRAGLGNVPGINEAIKNAPGAASDSERTQGVEALASFQEESHFNVSRKAALQYIKLVSSGLFKPEELIKRLRSGLALPDDAEIAARFAALTPEAQNEIEMRNEERQIQTEKEDEATTTGNANRRHDSQRELQKLKHPVASFLPGVVNDLTGGIPEAIDRAGNTSGAFKAGNSFDTWLRSLVGIKPQKQLDLTGHEPDRR